MQGKTLKSSTNSRLFLVGMPGYFSFYKSDSFSSSNESNKGSNSVKRHLDWGSLVPSSTQAHPFVVFGLFASAQLNQLDEQNPKSIATRFDPVTHKHVHNNSTNKLGKKKNNNNNSETYLLLKRRKRKKSKTTLVGFLQ